MQAKPQAAHPDERRHARGRVQPGWTLARRGRSDKLLTIQTRLRTAADNDAFSRWARWFFGDPPRRAVLPELEDQR